MTSGTCGLCGAKKLACTYGVKDKKGTLVGHVCNTCLNKNTYDKLVKGLSK